tara:strand:+ start:337 stop:1098 length:762 start_codon:yes stop_codon:yes gene_type:complete
MKASMTNSWLPDKKYYEFAYHKFFNPEVEYTSWEPWDAWDYPERDILRFGCIIKDQIPFIQNKKVLDLACHLGYLSLFCLHNNASFVTGTNVRQRELNIADEVCALAGYSNYDFLFSDLYDKNALENLVTQHDTIILSGVFYHINNHYDLLKTICKQGKTVIIETCLSLFEKHNSTQNIKVPSMVWELEDTTGSCNAYEENKSQSFVGYPNELWVKQALETLNMTVEYSKNIKFTTPSGNEKQRLIICATRRS